MTPVCRQMRYDNYDIVQETLALIHLRFMYVGGRSQSTPEFAVSR